MTSDSRIWRRKLQRNRHAIPAGLLPFVLAIGFGTSAAWGVCNSGSVGHPYKLDSAYCQGNGTGGENLAIGRNAFANGDWAIAIGSYSGPDLSAAGAITIGASSGYLIGAGIYSTAVGTSSQAAGQYSVAVGGGDTNDFGGKIFGAVARGSHSVAVGVSATAAGQNSVAIGELAGNGSASSSAFNSAFGGEAGRFVIGNGNTGVGFAAGYTVNGDFNSALGNSAGQKVSGDNNLAAGILAGTTIKGSYNAAFGDSAGRNVSGNNNLALGRNAGRDVRTSSTISIGTSARALGLNGIALGTSAQATATGSVAIGQGSLANAVNTVSVGSSNLRRRIVNVAPAVSGTDAVNLAQLQSLLAAQAQQIADLQLAVSTLQKQSAALADK